MMKARPNSASEKPLEGKRIVLTRAAEQATELDQALTDSGARVILLPCVEFASPVDPTPLDDALSRLSEFDWLVFTSQNAVRFFAQRQSELGGGKSSATPARLKVSALGSATAAAAGKFAFPPDFIAANARSGLDFVSEFAQQARGKKVLLPQSDQAGDQISLSLRDAGAMVTSVVTYRTSVPESFDSDVLASIERDGADMIFFSSPSAFRNFTKLVGEQRMRLLAGKSAFGAIGPTTAGAMRGSGAAVDFESPQPNSGVIVNAMTKYFARKEQTKTRA